MSENTPESNSLEPKNSPEPKNGSEPKNNPESEREGIQEETQEATQKTDSIVDNIKSRSIWLRLFFMLVIGFIWGVTRFVIGAVVVIQFFWVLFTGESNNDLTKLGAQLATYSLQVIRFLTFNTEERPFPFDLKWPEE